MILSACECSGHMNSLASHLHVIIKDVYYFLLTVATIGMRNASLTQTEDAVSIQVCVTLINSMQLEISLTAFVETSPITATGLYS